MADPIHVERMSDGRFQVCQGPLRWPFQKQSELRNAGGMMEHPQLAAPGPMTEEETLMMLRIVSVEGPDGKKEEIR